MSVTQQYITLLPGEEDRLPFLFLPGAEIRRKLFLILDISCIL